MDCSPRSRTPAVDARLVTIPRRPFEYSARTWRLLDPMRGAKTFVRPCQSCWISLALTSTAVETHLRAVCYLCDPSQTPPHTLFQSLGCRLSINIVGESKEHIRRPRQRRRKKHLRCDLSVASVSGLLYAF